MSDLPPGKYFIQLAIAPTPKPYAGANYGPQPLIPVILQGEDNVWTVNRLEDGSYTLVLEKIGEFRSSQTDGGIVVVGFTPATRWAIQGQDGFYTIEVFSDRIPKSVWAVDEPVPGAPVLLKPYPVAPPEPNHLWNFIRVLQE